MKQINAQYVFKLFANSSEQLTDGLHRALVRAFENGVSSQQTVQLGLIFGTYCSQEGQFMPLILNGYGLEERNLSKDKVIKLLNDQCKQVRTTFWVAIKKLIDQQMLNYEDCITMMVIIAADNGAGYDTQVLYLDE